jgi:hypothetical protein
MRRREFIAGLGAAAWPLAAPAQQGDRMRRIGVLMPFDENDPQIQGWFSRFTQGLAELGWTDGRNLRMDVRWTAGSHRDAGWAKWQDSGVAAPPRIAICSDRRRSPIDEQFNPSHKTGIVRSKK